MKQTILVTGGTGFIGSHTTVELIEAGYKVVIVDDLSNSKIEVLDGIEKITGVRPAFEQVDLRDKAATEAVFAKYPDIQGNIHFAALYMVSRSQKTSPLQRMLLTRRRHLLMAIQRKSTSRLLPTISTAVPLSRASFLDTSTRLVLTRLQKSASCLTACLTTSFLS